MECEILQQHHGHHHHLSSIDDRVEKLLGHFREEFQGELSVQNLGPKIGDYGTFLPTQLMKYPSSNSATENQILNSADMEKRIEKLFGCFRKNILEDNYMGAQFDCYGTFLSSQLRESQAPNAATKKHSSNPMQLQSLPGIRIAQKPAELVRTAAPPKVNTINIQVTKRKRETDMEPEESLSKIIKLMTSCPLSGKPMVSPLKQKLFGLRSVQTASTDSVAVVEDKIPQAPKRRTSVVELSTNSDKTNSERVKMNTQISGGLKPHTRTGMEKARSPLLQSNDDQTADVERQAELHATDATEEEEKSASARPRLLVKINIRNQSKAEEVHSNGKCQDLIEEPSKPKKKKTLNKVDAARRNVSTQEDSETNHDATESDNWVWCYKCRKRRLLPNWIDPEELIIKWSCSQTNWLAPGMNNCEINEHKYNAAVNKTMRHDPQPSKARKLTRTKRPSSKILEPKSCQKKNVRPNDIIELRITNKRRVIRRPRKSGCVWSQQLSMSTGSPHVLENLKEGFTTAESTLEKASLLLTEASDFKHRADRLKKGGQETLSNVLYLEAILKFLEVASLWEHKPVNRKQDAMRLFLQTASLSMQCASQCRDMQATVLYEAMELANKRAALLKDHPETDYADRQSEVDDFVIRAREARFM